MKDPNEIMKNLTSTFAGIIDAECFTYDETFCYIKTNPTDCFQNNFLEKLFVYCLGNDLRMIFSAEENVPVIAIRSKQ